MRLGPGFPMKSTTVSAHGCDVTITENEASGSKYTVDIKFAEYSLKVFDATAAKAVEQAAERMERSAKSLRELAMLLQG